MFFRLLDRIEFLVSEAVVAMRRNIWMTFSAVTTTTISLYIMGGLGYLYFQLNQYSETLPSRFEMRVFLKDNLTEEKIKGVEQNIKSMKGVKEVSFISKSEAWNTQQKEMPEVTEGMENPLPDSLKLTFNDLSVTQEIAQNLRKLPEVETEGVTYFDEEQKLITQILKMIQQGGLLLGGFTFITSGILIYNTIRLTILSRRREMQIMSLIGATRGTIIIPFILEGFFQGMVSGGIATGLLWITYSNLSLLINQFNATKFFNSFPIDWVAGILVAIGTFYGLICSCFALIDSKRKV